MADGLRPVPNPSDDDLQMRERRLRVGQRISEVLNAIVRPLLAIMMGGAIVYMALTGTITSGEFLGIAAVVVGFFFQSRESEKAQDRIQVQGDQLVELAKAVPPESLAK